MRFQERDQGGAVCAANISSSTSHSIRIYRRLRLLRLLSWQTFALLRTYPLTSAIFSIERPHTPTMAANRACWMLVEGRIAGARSALSTPLTSTSHWATMTCQRGMHTQRAATSRPRQFKVATPTSPSWLRNSRQFSASHAPRHGHLDPPRPGEECVFTVYS